MYRYYCIQATKESPWRCGHLCFSYQPNTEQNRVYAGRTHNYTMFLASPLPQRDVTYTTLVSFQFPTVKEPTLTTLTTSLHCSDS